MDITARRGWQRRGTMPSPKGYKVSLDCWSCGPMPAANSAPHSSETITIQVDDTSAIIHRLGATIISWKVDGQERLFVRHIECHHPNKLAVQRQSGMVASQFEEAFLSSSVPTLPSLHHYSTIWDWSDHGWATRLCSK